MPKKTDKPGQYEATKIRYVFRFKKTGSLHYRGPHSDYKRIRLGTDKLTVARERVKRLEKGEQTEFVHRKRFAELCAEFQRIKDAKAKNTAREASTQIKHLKPWFEKHCPYLEQFERDPEGVWAEYRIAQSVLTPKRKLGHDRKILVQILARGYRLGWMKRRYQARDFQLKEATEPVGRYLEDAEVKAILGALTQTENRRGVLQVLLAARMGLRWAEVMRLRVSEVDLERRDINLMAGRLKIRAPRKVPIPITNDVFPLLEQAVQEAEKNQGAYVFPYRQGRAKAFNWSRHQNSHKWWSSALETAKVDCRFHDLRHTAMTNALDNGMPPLVASKIFGATLETINRIYDHLRKDRAESFRNQDCHRFVTNGSLKGVESNENK